MERCARFSKYVQDLRQQRMLLDMYQLVDGGCKKQESRREIYHHLLGKQVLILPISIKFFRAEQLKWIEVN